MIQSAMLYAIGQHGSQVDKQDRPYHEHLRKVAGRVLEYGEDITIAAILHDVIEDTSATIDEIEEMFGYEVRLMVQDLTRTPGETYAQYISFLVNHGESGSLVIKQADLRTNMSDLPDHMYSLRDRYAAALLLIKDEINERAVARIARVSAAVKKRLDKE